jgi:hypothetical protein
MPEFLERRCSPAARWYLAVVSIVGYVLTKISVTIAAGGIVFETIMGIDFWTAGPWWWWRPPACTPSSAGCGRSFTPTSCRSS